MTQTMTPIAQSLSDLIRDSSGFAKFREDTFTQNFYAALCTNTWEPLGIDGAETGTIKMSWREASEFVVILQNITTDEESAFRNTDWLAYYLSGSGHIPDGGYGGYVFEGFVTDEVRAVFHEVGFIQLDNFNRI